MRARAVGDHPANGVELGRSVNGATDWPRDEAAQAAPTLYIFLHAGGSASFRVPFAKAFSPDIQSIAVQYRARCDGQG